MLKRSIQFHRRFGIRIRKQRMRVQYPWHATLKSVLLVPAEGCIGSLRQLNEASHPSAASPRAWPWSRARHWERTAAAKRQGQRQ